MAQYNNVQEKDRSVRKGWKVVPCCQMAKFRHFLHVGEGGGDEAIGIDNQPGA